jgi:hypothetical protein
VCEIAETIGISKERVGYILMKKWIWKSFAQDGCRACSQQIKTTLAWNIWTVLGAF